MFSKKIEGNLDALRFGLSGGILWGAVMFIFTLIAHFSGLWMQWMELLTYLYPGYKVTIVGSLVGAVWGFVDAFVALYLFAWLYNILGRKL